MRGNPLLAILGLLTIAAATRVGASTPPQGEGEAVAQIKTLGGDAHSYERGPDKPINSVDLHGTAVKDADLECLIALTHVGWLDLSDTRIVGDGLKHLEAVSKLRTLRLAHTDVGDAALGHIKRLRELYKVDLCNTRVTRSGIDELQKAMPNTRIAADPPGNVQVDPVAAAIVAIQRLEGIFSIDEKLPGRPVVAVQCPLIIADGENWSGQRRPFTNEGMPHLKYLPSLETVDLTNSAVSDAGLPHLKSLPRLRSLSLSALGITDAGLGHLAGLVGLEVLDLSGTQITDAGLTHLKGLMSLRELNLSDTKITDAGLTHLRALIRLTSLRLALTKVTDTGVAGLKRSLPKCSVIRERPPALPPARPR